MSAHALLAGPVAAGLALWRCLVRPAPGSFRILLLHDVPAAQAHRLAALLDYLGKRGGFISPDEAEMRLAGHATDRRASWLVSFDDGFASNHRIATTLLAERGIKALFFVCPGLVDLEAEVRQAAAASAFFADRPDPVAAAAAAPLMGWDQIEDLARMGHVIGAHSMTHRPLCRMEAAVLEDELARSRERLAAVLGEAPAWFAFPYGNIDTIDGPALAAISRHYRFCRSGVRGLNGPSTHPLALRAEHVDLGAAAAWQRIAALGGLDVIYTGARTRLDALAHASGHSAAP